MAGPIIPRTFVPFSLVMSGRGPKQDETFENWMGRVGPTDRLPDDTEMHDWLRVYRAASDPALAGLYPNVR